MQLDRPTRTVLRKVINAAASDINAALAAYQTQTFQIAHRVRLDKAHASIAKLLAWCSDGTPDQGGATVNVDGHTLYLLYSYEGMASGLIEAVSAGNGRQDVRQKIRPGRYAVSRRLVIANRYYQDVCICTNPAFGLAQLDVWEDKTRDRIQRCAA